MTLKTYFGKLIINHKTLRFVLSLFVRRVQCFSYIVRSSKWRVNTEEALQWHCIQSTVHLVLKTCWWCVILLQLLQMLGSSLMGNNKMNCLNKWQGISLILQLYIIVAAKTNNEEQCHLKFKCCTQFQLWISWWCRCSMFNVHCYCGGKHTTTANRTIWI